mmetsp:Transcript_25166/g.70343  ORF Transcript_25166/g.70343 Transcript_25166/m.70343 type:complete len:227 (+) Transcript_25166:606-1286(+)
MIRSWVARTVVASSKTSTCSPGRLCDSAHCATAVLMSSPWKRRKLSKSPPSSLTGIDRVGTSRRALALEMTSDSSATRSSGVSCSCICTCSMVCVMLSPLKRYSGTLRSPATRSSCITGRSRPSCACMVTTSSSARRFSSVQPAGSSLVCRKRATACWGVSPLYILRSSFCPLNSTWTFIRGTSPLSYAALLARLSRFLRADSLSASARSSGLRKPSTASSMFWPW